MARYKRVDIYVDGGSRNNGAPDAKAAWGVVVYADYELIYANGNYEVGATNSKMEIYSLVAGLTAAYKLRDKVDHVNIYQDSSYCVNAYNQWVDGWVRNNKTDKAYYNIWYAIQKVKVKLGDFVSVIKVKGHSDNVGNIEVDSLVNVLMDKEVDTSIECWSLKDFIIKEDSLFVTEGQVASVKTTMVTEFTAVGFTVEGDQLRLTVPTMNGKEISVIVSKDLLNQIIINYK